MKFLIIALLAYNLPAHAATKTSDGSCQGSSDMCAYVGARGVDACLHQKGCSWDAQFQSCSGIEASCSEMDDEWSCRDLSGCNWEVNPDSNQ